LTNESWPLSLQTVGSRNDFGPANKIATAHAGVAMAMRPDPARLVDCRAHHVPATDPVRGGREQSGLPLVVDVIVQGADGRGGNGPFVHGSVVRHPKPLVQYCQGNTSGLIRTIRQSRTSQYHALVTHLLSDYAHSKQQLTPLL
jgi:hypothetical protein